MTLMSKLMGVLIGTSFFNSKQQVRLVDKLVQVGILQAEFVECIINGLSVKKIDIDIDIISTDTSDSVRDKIG